MKLNTKVRYGLRAMLDIEKNFHGKGILQKEISQRQDISLKYLDSIITGLRNGGLIINTGGKGSGYKLAKPASRIYVYDIYRAFEPELTLVNCLCDSMECNRTGLCPAKDFWFELNIHLKSLMQNISLKQVMDGTFKF
ncbi:MAG: Rrf2 family transcriptional regulator [Bacteroidales bacterium]